MIGIEMAVTFPKARSGFGFGAILRVIVVGGSLLYGNSASWGATQDPSADPVGEARASNSSPKSVPTTDRPERDGPQEVANIDPIDTAFVLVASAMVILISSAIGLFNAGMVRSKNVLATFHQSFAMLGLIGLQWVIVGYTLAFGSDQGGLIGGLDHALLVGVSWDEPNQYAPQLPSLTFFTYQLALAVFASALLSGALAERVSFVKFVILALLWSPWGYDPLGLWGWGGGGGGASGLGARDFAGGLVIHVGAGASALSCAWILGHRQGYGTEEISPHNLTLTVLGTSLLWFGWLGLNAGGALGVDTRTGVAFLNTILAGASAMLGWSLIEYLHKGKATVLGGCTGAVVGLVAITPGAGWVHPLASISIGLLGSGLAYAAILVTIRARVDDALDVTAVHGVGGAFGSVTVGLFALPALAGSGALLSTGDLEPLLDQGLAVLAVGAYSASMTALIVWVLEKTLGLRVDSLDEQVGLDLSQHGERGYIRGPTEQAPDLAGFRRRSLANGASDASALTNDEPPGESNAERLRYLPS